MPKQAGVKGGAAGVIAKGCGVSFWSYENIQKLIVVMDAQRGEYTKSLNCSLQWVNLMVCELCQ